MIFQGLIDELVPGLAAAVDNILVGCEHLNTRFDGQLSRMNCQIFPCGLSSGLFEGSAMIEMFSGKLSLLVVCHPPDS